MRECDEMPGRIFDSDFARAIKRRSFGHVDFRFGDRGFAGNVSVNFSSLCTFCSQVLHQFSTTTVTFS